MWDVDLGVVIARPGGPTSPTGSSCSAATPQGRPDGFAVYHVEDRWDRGRPRGTLHLEELVGGGHRRPRPACGASASRSTGSPRSRPRTGRVDDLLPWLVVDAREVVQYDRGDLQWVRRPRHRRRPRRPPLPGARARSPDRGRRSPGPWPPGRFVLEGGPDGAECRPTTASGRPRAPRRRAGQRPTSVACRSPRWTGPGSSTSSPPGAVARADAMFRSPVAPWSMTHF